MFARVENFLGVFSFSRQGRGIRGSGGFYGRRNVGEEFRWRSTFSKLGTASIFYSLAVRFFFALTLKYPTSKKSHKHPFGPMGPSVKQCSLLVQF